MKGSASTCAGRSTTPIPNEKREKPHESDFKIADILNVLKPSRSQTRPTSSSQAVCARVPISVVRLVVLLLTSSLLDPCLLASRRCMGPTFRSRRGRCVWRCQLACDRRLNSGTAERWMWCDEGHMGMEKHTISSSLDPTSRSSGLCRRVRCRVCGALWWTISVSYFYSDAPTDDKTRSIDEEKKRKKDFTQNSPQRLQEPSLHLFPL
jgi:hypothetical protein